MTFNNFYFIYIPILFFKIILKLILLKTIKIVDYNEKYVFLCIQMK